MPNFFVDASKQVLDLFVSTVIAANRPRLPSLGRDGLRRLAVDLYGADPHGALLGQEFHGLILGEPAA